MIDFLDKNISINKPYQDKFDLKVINELLKRGVHYDELPSHMKHKALLKYWSICTPDVVRKGFIPSQYVSNPDIIVINRTPTMNDLKYTTSSDAKNPSNAVINKLVHELGFTTPYISSLSYHVTSTPNEWTLDKLKEEFYFKNLEFDNIEIPQVFLLLGNDALNVFFNTGRTVQNIFGDIYLSEYKGSKRLFIPIPHTAYLLRDKNLYKNTVHLLRALRSILQQIKN